VIVMEISVVNNGKNPNDLHDHLTTNGCIVISLKHDAEYGEFGEKIKEAENIFVTVSEEDSETANNLIAEFISVD